MSLSITTPRAPTRQALERLGDALKREDLDEADRILAQCHAPHPQQLIEPIGLVHILRQRWAAAADCLGRVRRPTGQTLALRRYAANMTDLQEHRPEVYDAVLSPVVTASASQRAATTKRSVPDPARAPEAFDSHQESQYEYEIDAPPTGLPTIIRVDPDGHAAPVILGDSTKRHIEAVEKLMDQTRSPTVCYALGGIGDGHVFARFLSRFPPDTLGMETPLYVIEPDAQLVRAVLMLHDLSGEDGPIRRKQIQWCVGPRWAQRFETLLRNDPFIAPPTHTVALTPQGKAAAPTVTRIVADVALICQKHHDEATKDYTSRTPDRWVSILRGVAGRKPRVLLVTSRFSTVLQHATRDAAQGFKWLGWDTHILIEPSPHHRVNSRAVHESLGRFRPDLIFTIDHLRKKFAAFFPDSLPFVTWIQDDLNHLISPDAGKSIGARDFVLTAAPSLYADSFGYPARQLLYVDKLTRVPPRPAKWTSDGDDLVFVSNASQTPESIIDQLKAEVVGNDTIQHMVARCCRDICEVYNQDRCLYSPNEVVVVIDKTCKKTGLHPLDRATKNRLALKLFNSLNNTLYRQQAIRWAMDLVQEMGLSLALYGAGWEKNPGFARYAKGPVAYGRDLEELTRRSKINLQIVPFSCLHQRLLDGLVAGGFYLIREHPFDRLHQELGLWLTKLAPGVRRTGDIKNLSDEMRQRFNTLHREINRLTLDGDDDPIRTYRRHLDQGMGYLYDTLPKRDDVTFDSHVALKRRVEQYLHRPGERTSVAEDQRALVENTRTYNAGLNRIITRVAQLIAAELSTGLPDPKLHPGPTP